MPENEAFAYLTPPGTARARKAGCTCEEQRPPRYVDDRPVWEIDPRCPIHGLDAARRYLDAR